MKAKKTPLVRISIDLHIRALPESHILFLAKPIRYVITFEIALKYWEEEEYKAIERIRPRLPGQRINFCSDCSISLIIDGVPRFREKGATQDN